MRLLRRRRYSDEKVLAQSQDGIYFVGGAPDPAPLPISTKWLYWNTVLDSSNVEGTSNPPAGWTEDGAIGLRFDPYANAAAGPIAVVLGDADGDGCVDIRVCGTDRVLPKIPIVLLQHPSKGCYPLQIAVELAHADDR
jgi:hypothetical protein